jgi:hypothetical protein
MTPIEFYISGLSVNVTANSAIPCFMNVTDVVMECTYSATVLNNAFQIYANNINDIQLIQINKLLFGLNSNYATVLPKTSTFIITTDPSSCGFLSLKSPKRTLGYEYLSYLSNKLFNTNHDFIKFIKTNEYIDSMQNLIDLQLTNLLSNMNKNTTIHTSREIYTIIQALQPNRFSGDISGHSLGNNWYSHFLFPGDTLIFTITITPSNVDMQNVISAGNNIQNRSYLFKIKLI